MSDPARLAEVVAFWDTVDASKKFKKDPDFDNLLIEKYTDLHSDIMGGLYDAMVDTPLNALAVIIVLDQVCWLLGWILVLLFILLTTDYACTIKSMSVLVFAQYV
jgi:hypothetical protein